MLPDRFALSLIVAAGTLSSAGGARAQDERVLPASPPSVPPASAPASPQAEKRFYGPVDPPPVSRRPGIRIFIPPIGGFGGFSADIGGGRVNVKVGPSGYGPYGEPAFGGINVDVFRPRTYYAPPVVYGPACHPVYGHGTATLYLGAVDGTDDDQPLLPSYTDPPAAAPDAGSLDTVVPPPPGAGPNRQEPPAKGPSGPSLPKLESGTVETTVPQRKLESGPVLPPQTSTRRAPRFFPVGNPVFLPPGVIPRNGFDVDNGVRPNAPTLPGDDPFGPRRPPGDVPPAA